MVINKCELCHKEDAVALVLRRHFQTTVKEKIERCIGYQHIFYIKKSLIITPEDNSFYIGLKCMHRLSQHKFSMRYATIEHLELLVNSSPILNLTDINQCPRKKVGKLVIII